eukprot:1756709-Pyramimonas_sp.AAC.2
MSVSVSAAVCGSDSHVAERKHRVVSARRTVVKNQIAGDQRAYSRGWNQSQGTREHIPGVGTNHRGPVSIFQGLEPIARILHALGNDPHL